MITQEQINELVNLHGLFSKRVCEIATIRGVYFKDYPVKTIVEIDNQGIQCEDEETWGWYGGHESHNFYYPFSWFLMSDDELHKLFLETKEVADKVLYTEKQREVESIRKAKLKLLAELKEEFKE